MPSSVIKLIEHNATTSRLRITFVSGSVYEYYPVPEEVYEAFRKSGSKGIYFNWHIKEKYEFEKIA